MIAVVKAEQLGLFPALPRRRDPLAPGSRGGTFYVDGAGHVRYGLRPIVGHPELAEMDLVSQVQTPVADPRSELLSARVIRGPGDVANVFHGMVDIDRERLWLLHMDESATVKAFECVSQGSLSMSIAHPREVIKNAVSLGTRKIAMVHNHPSGDPGPSEADREITRRVSESAASVGVEFLTHVVVGTMGWHELGSGGGDKDSGVWEPVKGLTKQIPEVQGRLIKQVPRYHVDIFNRTLSQSKDVADIGRRLLNPSDQTAAVIMLDQKHRLIGAFPIAAETTSGARQRIISAVTKTSAASVALVGAKDGPQWTADYAALSKLTQDLLELFGVNFLDSVTVGERGDYRSLLIVDGVRRRL